GLGAAWRPSPSAGVNPALQSGLALRSLPRLVVFCGAGFIPASGVRPGCGVVPTPVGRSKPGPTVEAGPSFAAEAGSFFVGPGLSRPTEVGMTFMTGTNVRWPG